MWALAFVWVYLAVGMFWASSCAGRSVPLHPGALNVFDSHAYDTLISAQAALKQARTDIDATPAFSKYRPQFNQVTAVYNTAMTAYKAYHGGFGGSEVELTKRLNNLTVALGTLLSSLEVQL